MPVNRATTVITPRLLMPVERNWAALWTLYSHTRYKQNHRIEAFWGFWRHYTEEDGSHFIALWPVVESRNEAAVQEGGWSLFKGLIGWRREKDAKKLQVLYFLKFPVGNSTDPEMPEEE